MDEKLFNQLFELTRALNKIGIKPVICGGLAIYLCFQKREGEEQTEERAEAQGMIRATKDIDLMLTKKDISEQAQRSAISEIITGELEYIVCENKKYHGFTKGSDQLLDVLAPPVEGLETENYRVKIVSSRLHGRVAKEACFVDEDLRIVSLSDFFPNDRKAVSIKVQVPSPTNLLVLKLCAFDDRDQGTQKDVERAQTHALDIYIIMMLTNREDFREGQRFLLRHKDSDIIKKVRSIVSDNFSAVDQAGWQRVLETSDFHPNLNRQEKEGRLDLARRRLIRWFNTSALDKASLMA